MSFRGSDFFPPADKNEQVLRGLILLFLLSGCLARHDEPITLRLVLPARTGPDLKDLGCVFASISGPLQANQTQAACPINRLGVLSKITPLNASGTTTLPTVVARSGPVTLRIVALRKEDCAGRESILEYAQFPSLYEIAKQSTSLFRTNMTIALKLAYDASQPDLRQSLCTSGPFQLFFPTASPLLGVPVPVVAFGGVPPYRDFAVTPATDGSVLSTQEFAREWVRSGNTSIAATDSAGTRASVPVTLSENYLQVTPGRLGNITVARLFHRSDKGEYFLLGSLFGSLGGTTFGESNINNLFIARFSSNAVQRKFFQMGTSGGATLIDAEGDGTSGYVAAGALGGFSNSGSGFYTLGSPGIGQNGLVTSMNLTDLIPRWTLLAGDGESATLLAPQKALAATAAGDLYVFGDTTSTAIGTSPTGGSGFDPGGTRSLILTRIPQGALTASNPATGRLSAAAQGDLEAHSLTSTKDPETGVTTSLFLLAQEHQPSVAFPSPDGTGAGKSAVMISVKPGLDVTNVGTYCPLNQRASSSGDVNPIAMIAEGGVAWVLGQTSLILPNPTMTHGYTGTGSYSLYVGRYDFSSVCPPSGNLKTQLLVSSGSTGAVKTDKALFKVVDNFVYYAGTYEGGLPGVDNKLGTLGSRDMLVVKLSKSTLAPVPGAPQNGHLLLGSGTGLTTDTGGLAVNTAGDIFLVGHSNGFTATPCLGPSAPAAGNINTVIAHVNSNLDTTAGDIVFTKICGGLGSETRHYDASPQAFRGHLIVRGSSPTEIFLAGTTNGNVASGSSFTITGTHAWVAKLLWSPTAGGFQRAWIRQLPSSSAGGFTELTSLSLQTDGYLYLFGRTSHQLPGYAFGGGFGEGATSFNAFAAKFDAATGIAQ